MAAGAPSRQAPAAVPPGKSHGLGDLREDRADLTTKKGQCDDRHDRDQREDERVFGQTLAVFTAGDTRPQLPETYHRLLP